MDMFASVLIANRGEIACRIARTAKRLGLRTVAVYSQADADALHVRVCDEAHLLGPPPASESYLRIDKLIELAKQAGAQCIHPGYGFLSENAGFAEACVAAQIVFVGPPPQAIRAMGEKDRAKLLMGKAGIPVVPGYHGRHQDARFLKEQADQLGYPVLIKAVAGGGGKGLRKVDEHADFDAALAGAVREAGAAFGDGRVLIEKYIASPRHIEFQVFADRHGSAIHLYERDCSLQRRHQKVIEEAPAPGMTAALREKMGALSVAAAKAIGYVGAGTVEFIAEGGALDRFWFMEMNTRLQVEHPVTEAVTGLDLVEWQFRVAAGEALPASPVALEGHAVEARLYAEDPEHGFLPSSGKIVALEWPPGIRIDTGVEVGAQISPHYDPLIAKLIAKAPSREQALARLATALDRTIVAGPRTNLRFLSALCRAPAFRQGRFDTSFIDRNRGALGAEPQDIDKAAAAFGVSQLIARTQTSVPAERGEEEPPAPSPWAATDAFQLSGFRAHARPVLVDGEPLTAQVTYRDGLPSISIDGVASAGDATAFHTQDAVLVLRQGRQTTVRLNDFASLDMQHLDASGLIRAPMHGKVLAILVEAGARVRKGERIAVIEAMKMEHTLTAPFDGVVAEIAVAKDSQIAQGAKLMAINPAGGQE
jgi:3-methylcrotonyl-CoA carboxylase alpha subunit